MAGRRKVTGRFFVILGLIAAVTAFAIYMTRDDPVREVTVEAGAIGQTRELDAVIMRNETVVSAESYARVTMSPRSARWSTRAIRWRAYTLRATPKRRWRT